VLAAAGFSMEECAEARHVILEGLDVEPDSSMFSVRTLEIPDLDLVFGFGNPPIMHSI
jgi:hypothetical protein